MALFYPGFVPPDAANRLPPSQATQGRLTATSAHSQRKAPLLDFAQGRLSRKGREKWGTRRFTIGNRESDPTIRVFEKGGAHDFS
jgi:tRNA U34 5-methylaminomethyl-2-thiouridine-forming methyltransferase MnmC